MFLFLNKISLLLYPGESVTSLRMWQDLTSQDILMLFQTHTIHIASAEFIWKILCHRLYSSIQKFIERDEEILVDFPTELLSNTILYILGMIDAIFSEHPIYHEKLLTCLLLRNVLHRYRRILRISVAELKLRTNRDDFESFIGIHKRDYYYLF